jgi:hypothetical protein
MYILSELLKYSFLNKLYLLKPRQEKYELLEFSSNIDNSFFIMSKLTPFIERLSSR